jgi:hypothetical protein
LTGELAKSREREAGLERRLEKERERLASTLARSEELSAQGQSAQRERAEAVETPPRC